MNIVCCGFLGVTVFLLPANTFLKGCFWVQANPLSADLIFERFLGKETKMCCIKL